MSKWIIGFQPNKKGNYLVIMNYPGYGKPGFRPSYSRLNYDPDTEVWNSWKHPNGFCVLVEHFSPIWWDEYKITENKTIRKLKF